MPQQRPASGIASAATRFIFSRSASSCTSSHVNSHAPATHSARRTDGVFTVSTRRSASWYRTVDQDGFMRNFIGLGMVLCSCVAFATPMASQPGPADPLNGTTTTLAASPTCRMVNGTADIDGATQNISGLACKQPDGTWQIQQQDTSVDMGDVSPPPPYPYYPYYDPWFYGPPVAFGF